MGTARRLVASQGLTGLTISSLEDALDFSRGVISYHFRNKDAIVRAVFESAIEEIDGGVLARVRAESTPSGALAMVVRANAEAFVTNREAGLILISFWSRLAAEPDLRERNAGLFAKYRERTQRVLAWGQEEGVFRGDLDAEAISGLVVAAVIGIATQVYFAPGAIDFERVTREACAAIVARVAVAPVANAKGP